MTAATGRRLRVAYLAHGIGGRDSGVRRLVLEQAQAWADHRPDVEVGTFIRCEAGTEEAWRGERTVAGVRASRLGMAGRFLVRELLSLDVWRWRPDVVYLRHTTVSPSLIVLAARFPTIVGGDLDDIDEMRMRSPLRYLYARLTRGVLLRRARRIQVVTGEIGRLSSIVEHRRPVDVFPNTIDLDAYPSLPAPSNPTPTIVFLGAPHLPWAGLDKLSRLARAFPEWRFEVIGAGREECQDPPANLVAHGTMPREAYLPIMARADVALGPLALHRKSLSEASALKVAEYLAYGIPVILAHTETAFPDGAPFLLSIPNAENNVEVAHDAIRDFVAAWRGRRVSRSDLAGLDVEVVEAQRLRILLGLARPLPARR